MCGSTGWWTSIAKRKRILIFISSLDICSCVASGVMDFCPLLWRIWWFSKNNGKLINDSALRILCVVLTYIFAIAIWDYLQHEYLDNLNSFRLDPQAQPSPCIVCMCQGLVREEERWTSANKEDVRWGCNFRGDVMGDAYYAALQRVWATLG
jgi:hypothetical protein